MTLRERISRLDHLQQSKMFKVIASCIIVAIGIAAVIAYAVRVNMSTAGVPGEERSAEVAATPAASAPEPAADPNDPEAQMRSVMKSNAEATERILDDVLKAREDWGGVAAGVAAGVGLALAVIWVGLGLTYLAVILLGAMIIVPLSMLAQTRTVAVIGGGLIVLTLAFAALLRLLTILLSSPGAVFAVARNTLAEAVRMKVGLIFIVLLIFALACLPAMLDPEQPLRYRVQSFLQYSVGGSFWLIALLVLTFTTASICFEQRDKVIWQTMTKPVSHAQYLLGKWIGVSGLAAVLLMVCGAAIFMFTEYLRDQPAKDERVAYVAADGGGLTDDRKVLEMQVLTARRTVAASPPEVDEAQFQKNLEERVQQEVEHLAQQDDSARELRFQKEAEIRERIGLDLRKSVLLSYRAIEPGGEQIYTFEGLADAKRENKPVILRFKIDAGSNAPDAIYRLTFQFPNNLPFVQAVGLAQFHTIELLPTVIDEEGRVNIKVQNGDYTTGRNNPETMMFSKDGLEVTYSVGGYRMNFVRVMFVLWVKLAFLAMLAICGATSLSFPVASLVAFTAFLAAEGSTFIMNSLEVYQTEDDAGKMMLVPTLISKVAEGVAKVFHIYGQLRPVPRLVSGLQLPWNDVAMGMAVLGLMTVALYIGAVVIFKRRELATYSGQ